MPPLLIIWLPIPKNTPSPDAHVTVLDCPFIGELAPLCTTNRLKMQMMT
jgi:hypothetical protein